MSKPRRKPHERQVAVRVLRTVEERSGLQTVQGRETISHPLAYVFRAALDHLAEADGERGGEKGQLCGQCFTVPTIELEA